MRKIGSVVYAGDFIVFSSQSRPAHVTARLDLMQRRSFESQVPLIGIPNLDLARSIPDLSFQMDFVFTIVDNLKWSRNFTRSIDLLGFSKSDIFISLSR